MISEKCKIPLERRDSKSNSKFALKSLKTLHGGLLGLLLNEEAFMDSFLKICNKWPMFLKFAAVISLGVSKLESFLVSQIQFNNNLGLTIL